MADFISKSQLQIILERLSEAVIHTEMQSSDYEFANALGLFDRTGNEFYYLPNTDATSEDEPDDTNILASQNYAKFASVNSGFKRVNKVANLQATDHIYTVELVATASDYDVNLPSSGVNSGRRYRFYSLGSNTKTVTLKCAGKGVNYYGNSSISTSASKAIVAGESFEVWWNGTTWLYMENN